MKLAQISHSRCDDYEGCHTLVWAPDDMSEDEFIEAVLRAQTAYLDQANVFVSSLPPNNFTPWGGPKYEAFPDRTVADIKAEWEEKKREYTEWDASRKAAARSFGQYLTEEGFIPFWKHEPELSYYLSWGHRHGQVIDYSETEVKDLPAPKGRTLKRLHP